MPRDDWEHRAEDYERRVFEVVGRECLETALDAVRSERNVGRAADVGCGTGLFTRPLAHRARQVTAIDSSEAMLDSARRKLNDMGNVQWVRASCLRTGLPSGELDTVLMANVLQMVRDRAGALAEASRILRPGGRLILLSWTASGMSLRDKVTMMWRYLRHMGLPPRGARNLDPDEARRLVESSGLVVDSLELLCSRVKCMHLRAHKPDTDTD
jgi:ABC-2 type transport system ATP-binding protein